MKMVNDLTSSVSTGAIVCLKWPHVKHIKIVGEDIGVKKYLGT